MLRRARRGQAVIETVLFVPLFMVALYGTFLLVTQGSMSERAQLGIRSGGMISTIQNPYVATSLYAMYGTIDGNDPDGDVNCAGALPDTSLLYTSRKTFWQPAPISSPTTSSCWESLGVGYEASGVDVISRSTFLRLQILTSVPAYLRKTIFNGSTTLSTTAATNFVHPASIGDLLSCTFLGQVVKSSLEGGSYYAPLINLSDYSAANASVTSPLPATLPVVISLPFPMRCPQTFAPQSAPPVAPAN